MSADVSDHSQPASSETSAHERADGDDLILAALNHLRRGLSADSQSFGTPSLARQTKDLCEWAGSMGLLLTESALPSRAERGGQEHDIFHEERTDRYFKVTRNGVFGLSPGIDLALVSSDVDARRFHLWEASPIEYLERLLLQNQLVHGLNCLEGVIVQGEDVAIVSSQPRFDLVPVSQPEIDTWFGTLGFEKVTPSGYYRLHDNLGVFDAHEKNLVRFEGTLIPFDVIPCHPGGGFLRFIADTLAAGHAVKEVRTITTSPRIA